MPRAQQVEALWNGLRDNSGNALNGGKVFSYEAGTTNPKVLYTAADKSTSATNPLILDAYGRAQVWADGNYKLVVKTSADVTLYTLDNQVYGYDDGELIWGGTSAGTANAQTLTSVGTITSYSSGQRFAFIAGNSNTSACTLNINGIGAVSIVKGPASASLSSGDIRSGQLVDVVYETGGGGRFRLMNYPSLNDVQNGSFTWGGTSGGSANAQTVSLSPAITAYTAGLEIYWIPSATNTGATTINVNGLGAKNILHRGQACVGGEVVSGVGTLIVYDGTQFELVPHGGAWTSWTPTISATLPLTMGSVTIERAVFMRRGSECIFQLRAFGTTGGSVGNTLTVTAPIAASGVQGSGPAMILNGSTETGGYWQFSGSNTLLVKRYDQGNFATGVTTYILAQGSFIV